MKKRVITLMMGTVMVAALLCGCGAASENETTVETESTVEEASGMTQYESTDGWKITYDADEFFVNDTLDVGVVAFNYCGECSGTTSVIIYNYPDKAPDELLYEKVGDIDDSLVERGEMKFGPNQYWAHFRNVKPENEDPNAGDVIYDELIAMEHNGGTILVETLKHLETDEAQKATIEAALTELKDSFEFVGGASQGEYSYMIGSYVYEASEEIDGQMVEYKNEVVLNEDHTCQVTFQDTVDGEWSGYMIKLNDGSEFEFTVEGDSLLLNMNDEWISFEKSK